MARFDCHNDLGFLPAEEIRKRQTALFNAHLKHLRNDSPYYREALARFPDREYSLDELQEFPITNKSDFADFGQHFIAVPREQIADLGFTSGTTGVPCQIAYTKNDLARLAYSDATGFLSAGMKPGDRVLLTCTMDRCFIAGLAYFSGVVALGATGIRNGLNTVESHAEILMRLRPEGIVGVPSFLARLVRYLEKNGLDGHSVRTAMCIGEPLRRSDLTLTELGEQLNGYWPGAAHSTYAASETQSSFAECAECAGGHAAADLVIPEILDQNGNRLPDGEIGESHNPETHLIPLVLDAASGKRADIKVFGTDYDTPDGSCIRDYVHVTDLASAHLLALHYLEAGRGSDFFNLGNAQGTSVLEVVEAARRVTGKDFKATMTERRPGDPPKLVGSSEKAMQVLGWRPRFADIDVIVKHAWNWHQHAEY